MRSKKAGKEKRVTRKKVSKRKAAKKKAAGRPAGKKKGAKKAATKKPAGYRQTGGGVYVPERTSSGKTEHLVAPSVMASGVSKAKTEIQKLMREFEDLTDGYGVAEIELAVSFSADGKFLGIGVGGDATVKVKLRPDDG